MSANKGKRADHINGSADRTTETRDVDGCSWREVYVEQDCPTDHEPQKTEHRCPNCRRWLERWELHELGSCIECGKRLQRGGLSE